MRRGSLSVLGLFVTGTLSAACADPCVDDGLGQDDCPTQEEGGGTEGATESESESDSQGTLTTGPTSSATPGMSDSQSGTMGDTMDTLGETESESATDSSGTSLWCVDADGDGFGDPDDCQQSEEPLDGSVPNGDDCDDSNANTFPGAAPNDDPDACMQDEDGDDWGDDDPPSGVEPGSDCDDDDANTFPGAAENEDPRDLCARDEDDDGWGDDDPPPGVEPGSDCDDTNPDAYPGAAENEHPPDLCTVDEDGDGWGDANPPGSGGGGGPVPGSDCYDGNADLNPDTLQLTAFSPYQAGPLDPRTIDIVDTTDASLSPFVVLQDSMGATPNVDIVTATLSAEGEIFANDLNGVQLYSVEYADTCMMDEGTVTPVGNSYGTPGDIVCGLEFASDGMLYGIDNQDNLSVFDPAMGQITDTIPLLLGGVPLPIQSCGMAYDCTEDRLLVANGSDRTIYSVDPESGDATVVRDLSAFFGQAWLPTGLAYDPVSRDVYVSIGGSMWSADLDTDDPPVQVGAFGEQISNLQFLPICL